MGNGVSANQGNLPSYGSRDVKTSVCRGQHDWLEQAEAPETHSLSTTTAKSYRIMHEMYLFELVLKYLDLLYQLTSLRHVFSLQSVTVFCCCTQVCRQRANDVVTANQCQLKLSQLQTATS